jgi:Transglycosylase SLT domain
VPSESPEHPAIRLLFMRTHAERGRPWKWLPRPLLNGVPVALNSMIRPLIRNLAKPFKFPFPGTAKGAAGIVTRFVVVFALGISIPVHADIWGYVDESGRSHIATEKLDDRYQLFFKGGTRVGPPDARDAAATADAKAREEFRNTPLFQRITNQPNATRFEALIQQYAKMYKLDPALVKAVIAVESAFQPNAVSAKGALGLMQIIPDTGERYGIVGDRRRTAEQKLLDPATNLRIGTRHLRELLWLFAENIELALAAYNAGEQAVERYERTIPPFPETREYVKLVQQFYSIYRPPPAPPASKPMHIVIPGQRNAPGVSRSIP